MIQRVVVIGGGVAGLACAAKLLELEPACEVTVVEAEEELGGLAALWRCGPYAADLGPHRVYTELPEIAALLPQLIASEQTFEVARRSQLYLEGGLYEYPVRAGELLRRMGLVRLGYYGLSALAGQVESLVRQPRHYAMAMRQAFGPALYRKLIAPYTQKVWKTPPEHLSEEVARVRVSAGNTSKILKRLVGVREKGQGCTALDRFTYIRGGVEGLVRALEGLVMQRGGSVELGSQVKELIFEGPRVKGVRIEAACGGVAREIEASAVISTMPITALVGLAAEQVPEAAPHAGHLEFVGMILIGVALAKPRMSENCWIYFPEEEIVFNRAYEPKNFDPSMAPSETTMVVFEVTARHGSPLWRMPDAELGRLVVHDAAQAGLFRAHEVTNVFTRRLPYAYPIYTVDYRRHLVAVCRALQRIENLLTTGRQGLFNHNNMDHSMLMGIRAAECLAEQGVAQAATHWYSHLDQFAHFRIVD